MMASMDVGIEVLLGKEAAGEVVLLVDFKYRSGSPASFYDPGDPPEVEVETIFWPIKRYEHEKDDSPLGIKCPGKWVDDHIEMPYSGLPAGVVEAIESYIIEHYNPADDYDADLDRA